MTTLQMLMEWALRSGVLILGGALLLWGLRVKSASIRLAAWTAMLCGSLAIPALNVALPRMPFQVMRAADPIAAQTVVHEAAPANSDGGPVQAGPVSRPFDWARAALIVYLLAVGALLARLGIGLVLSIRLRRASGATGRATQGIEIRESELLDTPVALGILRPAILLPADWRQWDDGKLNAVLAHERSHIRRYDPAVQLLSAIHRALLWFSPLSWFLHQRLVRVAEEASDDAAVESTCDRALYANVLLEFMRRGVRSANWLGVPMARHGRPDQRIHRILDGTTLSRGVTRWSMAAILALGMPLVYLAAVARPIAAQQESHIELTPAPAPQETVALAQRAAEPQRPQAYLRGLGAVVAYTVTVKARVDGELTSVGFKDGETVQAGQTLATIDPRPYQLQLAKAEGQLARDEVQLAEVMIALKATPKEQRIAEYGSVAQLDNSVKADRVNLDSAKLELSYTQILSPITGVAGLRLVDPGNMVHASDPTGIVIINQIRPIAVLFSIPEDKLPQVLARMSGAGLPAEAWSRDSKVKLATGRLKAVDNQIDTETGTVKLKAEFDNKDGALFPNQFVNVRVPLSGK